MKSRGKYIRVFDENRGCSIFEHDKVWLDYHGYTELKSITEYKDGSYIIHHKNGDRSDNRIENLELMTRSEHAKFHAKVREPEYYENLSNSLKGLKRSDENRKHMSEARKGKPKYKLRGRPLSDEHKQKLRQSNIETWSKKPLEEKMRLNEINRQQHLGKPAPNKGIPCPQHQREFLSNYWKEKYANGFIPPSKGRIFVTNGEHNRQIYPEQLDEFLSKGYARGFTRKKRGNNSDI